MLKDIIVTQLKAPFQNLNVGAEENYRNSQNTRNTDRDLNPVPLTDEAGVPTSQLQHSVSTNSIRIFFKIDFVSISEIFALGNNIATHN
jgi:hypothetical protein